MNKHPERVVIISDFSQANGGASKLAVLLAERLAATGQPVTLFAGDHGGKDAQDFDTVNLGADALLAANPLRSAMNGIWNNQARRCLAEWIVTHDTPGTLYHVHGFMQTLSPSVFAALHSVRHRTVIHAHDYFLACPNGAFFDYQKGETCARVPLSRDCITCHCDKRNYPQKLWRVARQAGLNAKLKAFREDATFLLLHDRMVDYLHRADTPAHNITVANPAEAFLPEPVHAEQNEWFCYVGDIHDYKGVSLFAQAAQQAGVTAHFIGDGQDAEKLKNQYPSAKFHGWQDRGGLRHLLANARAVVVPSRGPEPFGLTCVEAMLSGIPVIASDSILLGHGIAQHQGGVVFSAGNARSLATQINAIASDDRFVAELSRKAPAAAANLSTTPEEWCRQIVEVYHGVLARSNVFSTSHIVSEAKPARAT